MLCCEAGGSTLQQFEDLAVFVSQLNALGVDARIDVRSLPEGLRRNAQFDVAPHLFDGALGEGDKVVILGAHRLSDERLVQLRRLARPGVTAASIIGSFPTRQAMIGTTAKVSYVFGADPDVIRLGPLPTTGGSANLDGPVFGVAQRAPAAAKPHLLLVAPALAEAAQARALAALALSRRLRLSVLSDGEGKAGWIEAHGTGIPIYHYGEVLPAALASRVDLCVCFQPLQTSYRVQSLIANLAVSGAALIDGTPDHQLAATSDAFIPGPPDVTLLGPFLTEDILPNLPQIGARVRRSRTAEACDPRPLLRALGAEDAASPARARMGAVRRRPTAAPVPVVFVPTNGIGLGHARRCTLVARALAPDRVAPVFAAFPGCMKLVRGAGFDVMPLISRSQLHLQSHENDLVNYVRLRALSRHARTLVFDGGYVFDSIYRTILENRLTGVWIRRGLWQAGQDNRIALDREKVFDRVVVPGEAFEELNAGYSRGEHVRVVGPIVQEVALGPGARAAARAALAERFGRPFERLVVSLLGSGRAADRSAQIQALCGIMARRPDVLHLVVVWPNAVLHPGWFTWDNTRIVRTQHAATLGAAADLWVSAAGYNSFHEALYGAIPTIFVPQTGPFMDDQRARAAAAAERGLAAVVAPSELVTLEREVARFLDAGEAEAMKARLEATTLPAPGGREAARLIEEVANAG